MAKGKLSIPNLDICTLTAFREDDLIIRRLDDYLNEHQNLIFPHRHSFYQIVFFTQGGGNHIIDFNHIQVKPLQIYFMIPGQVHSWNFEGSMNGYIVNFSNLFFQSFLLRPEYLDSFPFFNGTTEDGVINLSDMSGKLLVTLFESLLVQSERNSVFREDMIRVLLIQIFITIEQVEFQQHEKSQMKANNAIIRRFQNLVEKNFRDLRLPGAYADLLNITPNHLNALTKEHLGKQAGEVIRERIVLEAKRLLVSMDLSISEIAYKLNFNDNSYFGKFFKKDVNITPEAFRMKFASKASSRKFV